VECTSSLGLRTWKHFVVLEYRLVITNILAVLTETVVKGLGTEIKRTQELARHFVNLRTKSATQGDWAAIHQGMATCIKLSFLAREIASDGLDVLEPLQDFGSTSLIESTTAITRIIDFSESKRQRRVVTIGGIDDELDYLKTTYANLGEALHQYWVGCSAAYPVLPESRMAYFPQLGFFVSIARHRPPSRDGIGGDEDIAAATHALQPFNFEMQVRHVIFLGQPIFL